MKREGVKSLFEIARKTPLRPIIRWGGKTYRDHCFKKTMKKILSDPQYFLNDHETLAELSYGWGNEGYSANIEYLQECIQYTTQSKLPILECGSGLSTIVVGLMAKKHGNTVWSLEHMKPWYIQVKQTLEKYNIDSVKLIYGPVVEYGDYDWYNAPLDSMPSKYSLVICDGPADTKKRAKHSIFPIMKDRFETGCIILYDDAGKVKTEDDIPGWVSKLNMSYEIRGKENPYYIFKTQ